MKRLVLGTLAVIVFGVLALGVLTVQSDAEKKDKKQRSFYKFNDKGELERPEGYRQWIFVGTPVTPNSLNNGKAPFPEFHNVYIDPKSFRHYSKTGEFREGTILIKELVSVGATKAASGNGFFEGDFIGLEATIKDSKRFPD